MTDATSLTLPCPGWSATLFPNKSVEPHSIKGPENVNITTLYRCTGRLLRAATRHNNSCCDLYIIWKKILWNTASKLTIYMYIFLLTNVMKMPFPVVMEATPVYFNVFTDLTYVGIYMYASRGVCHRWDMAIWPSSFVPVT